MGKIVEVAREIHEGMTESQHQELDMLRKLQVIKVTKLQGANDEDCEQQWLKFMNLDNNETLYVAEPGNESK